MLNQPKHKRSLAASRSGSTQSPSAATLEPKTHAKKIPVVFFGNEKLATGITNVKPVILETIQKAGFLVEQHITGKLSDLKPHRAKLAVLAAYGRIIPQSVLDEFPLGIINVHPSLLPKYRGPTPIEQAILDGADKTGVSIMRLNAEMDGGPLYRQQSIALTGQESKQELAEKLQRLGANLLAEVLPKIVRSELRPRQQPHPERATYSHLLNKDDGQINLSVPADQLARQVRAHSGWPGSRIIIKGKEVIILNARISDRPNPWELSLKTSSGYLIIDRLKPAGRREMTGQAFISGYSNRTY